MANGKNINFGKKSWNPTIFNIIRWDDGTMIRSSRRLMVQFFFDRLRIIWWDSAQKCVLPMFPFQCIYYCHSSKFARKETGKTHLCAVGCWLDLITVNKIIKLEIYVFMQFIKGYGRREVHGYFSLLLCKSSIWFEQHIFKIIIYFFTTSKCATNYIISFEVYDDFIGQKTLKLWRQES